MMCNNIMKRSPIIIRLQMTTINYIKEISVIAVMQLL